MLVNRTTVVHCKNPHDVYIGRPSKWGNPYSHKSGTLAKFKTKTRQEAITNYAKYLFSDAGKNLLTDIHELKGKVLGCWCKPKACHGDILRKLANNS